MIDDEEEIMNREEVNIGNRQKPFVSNGFHFSSSFHLIFYLYNLTQNVLIIFLLLHLLHFACSTPHKIPSPLKDSFR